MRRYVRYFKIGWTIACATAAVLTVVLWVRSYWWWDVYNSGMVGRQSATVGSSQGWLGIVVRIGDLPGRAYSLGAIPYEVEHVEDMHWEWHASRYPWGGREYEFQIPYWFPVGGAVVLGAATWMPWRFSLRTMLIAITLLAVALGSIVWLSS